ncbi:TPA: hypothetical protein H2A59_001774 [Salmonella enterica]|uniref:Uncharacterized protein n=1 Tax=Salmonella enterica TaxID=28901 RepID=A0A756ID98_SALER|nr:hypothetical protein [Salmonella enterica]HAG0015736.1 hypothetical protein [Salmonella enterica]HAK3331317.1 hypothetical protein [Salmonella enterica]
MAFSWTEERIHYLRENAGKLKAREIADALGTDITAVRNMAVRLKLSLRVTGYTHEQVEAVRELYASQGDISIREISRLTGLAHGVVSYILYDSNRKKRSQYHRVRFIEFETEEGVRLFVQAELVDAHRTRTESLTGGQGLHDIWLLDGTHYKGKNVSFAERIMSGDDRRHRA